jgi:hypothetical protein
MTMGHGYAPYGYESLSDLHARHPDMPAPTNPSELRPSLMKPVEEITPEEWAEELHIVAMTGCPDCDGYGIVDGRPCTYCLDESFYDVPLP